MGAAVTLKDHLSFSIVIVFLFSLISLIFALSLSWAGKPNVLYFLLSSFMLSVLGSILCTNKKLSISEAIKLVTVLRGK
ncbi:hypothetical protein OA92_22355 [Marinomonas sp. SBI22]|nr:hypothetical protein OA92_22355 [Marinomonas sp. SBI22]KZM39351.1 hypothetical protein OA91_22205 [Marinomonas sp. SBI8L]